MAVLEDPDAARWHELGGPLAQRLERQLGPEVLANRAALGPDGWRFRPFGPALRRARRLSTRLMTSWPAVIRTDVAEFYPSVQPETLHRTLRAAGVDRDGAAQAASLLEAWGSHGYPGLPIGPPSSAVMANAVLRPVDEALRPLPFVRWVDDYLIALPAAAAAEQVLDRIDEALDRVGLLRAVHKTVVVQGRRPLRWLGASLMP